MKKLIVLSVLILGCASGNMDKPIPKSLAIEMKQKEELQSKVIDKLMESRRERMKIIDRLTKDLQEAKLLLIDCKEN